MSKMKNLVLLSVFLFALFPAMSFAADPDTCTLTGTKVHPFSQPTDTNKIINSIGAGSVPRISPSNKYVASGGQGISLIDLTKKTLDPGHPFESVQLTTDQMSYKGFDTGSFTSDEKRHIYFVAPTDFNTDTYIRYVNLEAVNSVYESGEFLKDTTGNIRLGDVLQKDSTTDFLAFTYQSGAGGHPSGVYITEFTNPGGKPQAYDPDPVKNPWRQITMSVPGADSINNIGNVFWDKSLCEDSASCTLGLPKADTLFIRADCQAAGGVSGSAIYKVTGIKAIMSDPTTAITSKTDARMVQVTPCLPWLNFPTASPDGKWIAAASKADASQNASVTNKETLYIFPTDGCAKNAAVPLEPTGKFALETSRTDAIEISATNTQWSSDGGKILYSSGYGNQGSVRLFSLLTTETATLGVSNIVEDAGYNKLEIKADALSGTTDISLSKPLPSTVVELDKTTTVPAGDILSPVVLEVEATSTDILKADKSAGLTMLFSDLDIKDLKSSGYTENDLTIYSLDEQTAKWESVGQATVDPGKNTVSVDITPASEPTVNVPVKYAAGAAAKASKKYRIGASKAATGTTQYNLKITNSGIGAGAGTVTSTPAGIDCGSTCSALYDSGTTVTLTATPTDANSLFAGWSGACSGTGATCTVTLSSDNTVGAKFVPKKTKKFTLKVISINGTVASGTLINCTGGKPDCSEDFYEGTNEVVTLTAEATKGYKFKSWTGCDSSAGAQCTVTMSKSKTVTAKYDKLKTFMLKVISSGGTVTSGTVINCTNGKPDCSELYVETAGTQETAVLTAVAATGYKFNGWTGCGSGAFGSQCTVTVSKNQTVTAKYARLKTFKLAVKVSPSNGGAVMSIDGKINCGGGNKICTSTYVEGTADNTVVLEAIPGAGYTFKTWSGCGSTDQSMCTVTVSANKTVTAKFTKQQTKSCKGNAAGVTYTPVAGCSSWSDADKYTGWFSVVEANGGNPSGTFTSGTSYTGYGCTIKINCP